MAERSLKKEHLLGALDASVVIAYMLGLNPLAWHVLTAVAKLAIATVRFQGISDNLRANLSFVWVTAILILSSGLLPNSAALGVAQGVTFLLHLSLTLQILRPLHIGEYCAGICAMVGLSSVVHIESVYTGAIQSVWGRFLYFHGAHPNLGSEINAVGVTAAALSLRFSMFLPVALVAAYSTFLMQGRAALLVCIVCALIKVLYSGNGRPLPSRLVALLGCAAVLTGLLAVTGQTSLVDTAIDTLFLTSNHYRGLDSGFAGRTDSWVIAWSHFTDSPIFGNGIWFFESMNLPTPHNFVLYALAQFGLMSLVFIGFLIQKLYYVFRLGSFPFAVLSTLAIQMFFNDRFINLNPYPFLWYVCLLTTSALYLNTKREFAAIGSRSRIVVPTNAT